MARKLKIKQVRSIIGQKWDMKLTIEALGLHRINHVVCHEDNPVIRGMVRKVRHLVEITEE